MTHPIPSLQARANKSKDKPDADLHEFEKVNGYSFSY
jgi:hypothetical protein